MVPRGAGASIHRLSVHHLVPARLGGDDSMDNLVTVCVLHHRQADARLQRARQAERFDDDPERGIYWGPPSEPGGTPRRWSRHWFDWRPEELGHLGHEDPDRSR
jgi:hypothetical protein